MGTALTILGLSGLIWLIMAFQCGSAWKRDPVSGVIGVE